MENIIDLKQSLKTAKNSNDIFKEWIIRTI